VQGCAEGLSNKEVTARVGVSPPMGGASKWRSRFVELRLVGLDDDPRPGRPASITAEHVEDVVVSTLESTPKNATHWSRASMAQRSGLSKSSIGRIWRAFELKLHRTEGFNGGFFREDWGHAVAHVLAEVTRKPNPTTPNRVTTRGQTNLPFHNRGWHRFITPWTFRGSRFGPEGVAEA